MNPVAARHLRMAVIYAMIGMVMGLGMGMADNFAIMPAHAHLNLVGWVSAALYGLFLRGHPDEAGGIVRVHFWVAHAGIATMFVGLIVMLGFNQNAIGLPLSIFGGVLSLIGMAMFATIVFRLTAKAPA